MMVELFSVMDEAAHRFLDPFPAPTVDFALRSFREAVITEGHQFAKFPEDYALYHIGRFNPEVGVLETLQPRKIASAVSFTGGFGNQLEIGEDAS